MNMVFICAYTGSHAVNKKQNKTKKYMENVIDGSDHLYTCIMMTDALIFGVVDTALVIANRTRV